MGSLLQAKEIRVVSSPFYVSLKYSEILVSRYELTWLKTAREEGRDLTMAESAALGSALNAEDPKKQLSYFDKEDRLYLLCFSGNVSEEELSICLEEECRN